ncbi:MAG: hypothetical protein U5N86_09700 [Planctomycetota bacterium]|nr:hypothetical protein [Planctomycetota bacterium]
MTKVRRALVSVSDKTGIVEFCAALNEMDVAILSTGGTARKIRDAGIPVTDVSEHTGSPEILDGRVKTLHPKIHGGILYRRDLPDHVRQLEQQDIASIDMVVCNLYPFEKTVAKDDVSVADAIENIDIGGPTMVRASAKNHAHVAVVVAPAQYAGVIREMRRNSCELTEQTRYELALAAFRHTAHYDCAISTYLSSLGEDDYPPLLWLELDRENLLADNKGAALYSGPKGVRGGAADSSFLCGDSPDMLDVKSLFLAADVSAAGGENSVVAVSNARLREFAAKSSLNQSIEALGNLPSVPLYLALGGRVTSEVAAVLAKLEGDIRGLAAPAFEDETVEMLQQAPRWGREVRLLKYEPVPHCANTDRFSAVKGGFIASRPVEHSPEMARISARDLRDGELNDGRLAWMLASHCPPPSITAVSACRMIAFVASEPHIEAGCRTLSWKCKSLKGATVALTVDPPALEALLPLFEVGVEGIVIPGKSRYTEALANLANSHGAFAVTTGYSQLESGGLE